MNADFYISSDGNDNWSGTLPDPGTNRRDGPFASLARAQEAVRKLKKAHARPITVFIRTGTYPLEKPVVFTPSDSGTAEAPITYAAYPGETPILSGGRALSGWRTTENGLWEMELPKVKAEPLAFRQLFINGERRERSRFPSQGYLKVQGAPDKSNGWAANLQNDGKSKADCDLEKRAFKYKPGDLSKNWKNLEDVEIVVLQYWMEARLRIQEIDENTQNICFTGSSWRPLIWSFGYYADNVFEGMVPGTWYLDRPKGRLYYQPKEGETIDTAKTTVPVTTQLMLFKGDAATGQYVTHIHFNGLSFQHADWELPPNGYAITQAEIDAPAAVSAEGLHQCHLTQCVFSHLGAWAIEFGRGCQDNTISGSIIHDIGAGCIKIGEPVNRPSDAEEACRITVSDNQLLDGGHVYLGSAAIWVGQSSGNTICHNELSGAFQWAISLGWNWQYFPLNRTRDNTVEFNHIHHLGTGVLGTHGAIYCLGVSPNTLIRNNYIHHVFSNKHWGAGEGIILDNGCVGILIENNLVHDAVAGGWGCNFNNFGNIIQNNIFAYGNKFQLTRYGDQPAGPPPPNGEIFARNIIVWKEGPLFHEDDWLAFSTLWNYNLYYNTANEPVRFMKYSFDEWKSKGIDLDSVVADPLFADPEHGNFRLLPESPAFKLGFKEFEIDTVGPRKNAKSE